MVPLAVILLLTAVVAAMAAPTAILRHHYRRVTVWAVASVPLWLIGAAMDTGARAAWWAGAAAVDTAGVRPAHPLPRDRLSSQNLVFDAAHMAERIRLFGSACSSSSSSAKRP